ncbi:MAG TPA: DUF937 domain-containing protein [Pyrinomonadaceae bacterium]|nr:DUF937 domain-containing protein [Pyrinomonadaceae bacterium]
MNAITQMIMQQLSGGASRTIAQRLGVSESTANTAVQVAVPLLLAALARNASVPQGAENLHQAINKDHHDGSILDNLMGYLGNPQTANGAGILSHVFGGQRPAIENNLAQATGMDQGSAGSLLETLAPVVMGAVGQAQQQNGLDPSGLSNLLNKQEQQAEANAPGVMGMLNSMLDQNKDGSSMDDLQRMAANFFK